MLTRREAAVAAVATLAAQVADALPAAATAIQPPGSPRPLPPERKVKISNVVATAPLGVPIDVPTSGWLPNEKILWSVLRNNAPASTWRTNPPSSAIADAKGNAIIKATFAANADFLRVMAADRSVHQDSVTVATKPPAPAPSGDAAFSFAFRDALRHGVNFERWRPVYMNFRGHPTASSPAYYQYLKDHCGVNFVRFHYPWHNTENMLGNGVTIASGRRPSIDSIRQFIQPLKQCAAAGVRVIVDVVDVCSWDMLGQHWTNVAAHISSFAQEIANNPDLSPTMCAVGPYSELIEWKSTNLQYNKFRMDAHALIRAKLPKHIIVHGANKWDDWTSLTAKDWAAPPDKLSMGTWHGYFAADSGPHFWAGIQSTMKDFSARVGIPTFCGEAGLDDPSTAAHQRFSSRWLQAIDDQTNNMPNEKPCWWAVTDGSSYRMSVGGADPTLIPELAAKLSATAGRLVSH